MSLSAREAFGLVLLEAAVAGSRVVASDIPAHAELAHRLGRVGAAMAVVTPDVAAVAAALDSQVEMGRLTMLPDQRLRRVRDGPAVRGGLPVGELKRCA